MGPCHAETGSPSGTGHYYIGGSRDTPLHVELLGICWIVWLWMVQTIYNLTLQIDLKIDPSHQAGEEKFKLGSLHRFFCDLCQTIIKRKMKSNSCGI